MDSFLDKWASTVEQVSVVSDAFRQDPVVIVQQFYLEDSSIPSSFKSRYYIAPPEFTFFVPCPIDIQHPAVENIRPELSRLFDSRIPIIVQPKITDRGAPSKEIFIHKIVQCKMLLLILSFSFVYFVQDKLHSNPFVERLLSQVFTFILLLQLFQNRFRFLIAVDYRNLKY